MDQRHQCVINVYTLMYRTNSIFVGAPSSEANLATRVERPVDVDLDEFRTEIRQVLTECRELLSNEFSERTVYRLLFGFTVFFDEAVLAGGRGNTTGWRSLQRELYDTDEGGTLFYEALDEVLAEENISLVYEAFYFCLKLGFRGKLAGQEKRVEAYKDALISHFDLPPVSTPIPETSPVKVFRLHSYHWYYTVALSCNVAFWAAIRYG
jgi:type IV/VI secretion system ImpK/VasF family protein